MADLLAGNPANGNGTPPRVSANIRPTGSPSGIRGPRMIMQERAAREARQREERELREREREYSEREARLQAEAIRREEERQAAVTASAAAAGAGPIPQMSNQASNPSGSHRRNQSSTSRPKNDTSSRPSGSSRPPGTSQQQNLPRHEATASLPAQPVPSAQPQLQGVDSASAQQGQGGSTAASRTRNSFPHAFERWETLSAHWEGLTSFWIRRLEQNIQDVPDDQVTKQLARQVTDLSSAGANLFHAVVELQRLRASSERKFQRWFFETRAELERNQEVTAMLETALEEERRSRADAIQEALKNHEGSEKLHKTIAEMRKELTISKEEARRAWEELGRREQEERDRMTSLQQGFPTIVGGVQVVPMTQGLSRGASQRDPQQYGRSEAEASPARAPSRPEYSPAPAVQPPASVASSATYQAPGSGVHRQQSYGSEATFSDGEYIIDAQGQFVRDARGQKIPFRSTQSEGSDAGTEDFETPATQPGVYTPRGNTPQAPMPPPSQQVPPQVLQQQQQQSGGQHQQPQQGEPDYSGEGFSAPGWEQMPRHHHPTRLSDVLEEEEERSRTSVSVSQVSRF